MEKHLTLVQFFTIFIYLTSQISIYKKVLLKNPDALCLDGSPGAYYIHQGLFRNKWVLNFEYGGWCGSSAGVKQTLQSCLLRSKTELGSSSGYSDIWYQQDYFLSDSPLNHYRDWSMVHLKYCTGTGHQGYKKDPVYYNGQNLYFRGHNVTVAQIDSLHFIYNLFSASTTDIIVAGQSAGGLAAFLWANYIRDRAAPSTRVICLPDAGIFLDSPHMVSGNNQFRMSIQNFMKVANVQVDPPTAECNAAYPNELWKCMFAEYIYDFIKVPLFVIQSPYDTWCLRQIIGIACENRGSLSACNQKELSYIEDYKSNNSKLVKAIAEKSAKNGYWLPSCSIHTFTIYSAFYDNNYRIPSGSTNSAMKAVIEWEEGQSVNYRHMDYGSWPTNQNCSGLAFSLEQMLKFIFGALIIVSIGIFIIHYIYKKCKARRIILNEVIEQNQSQVAIQQKN